MSYPYGTPHAAPPPQQKSRTGLYIGIACGCLLLVLVLIAAVAGGLWFLGREGGEDPTLKPTTSSEPTSEDPTSDDPATDEPTTDDPTTDDATVELKASAPQDSDTLDWQGEEITSENGKFIIVTLTVTNNMPDEIDLDVSEFTFFDASGSEVFVNYVSAGSQTIATGETMDVRLVADVPTDVQVSTLVFSDPVGTNSQPVEIALG